LLEIEPRRSPHRAFPARFLRVEAARRRFGAFADRMGEALLEGDPLADAAAAELAGLPREEAAHLVRRALARGLADTTGAGPALRTFFEAVDRRPRWVDEDALARGGELLFRAGSFGGTVLGVESLPYGYASPGGNKPLAASGRLRENAPRRLAETSRFVQAVSLPGGMDRFSDGFAITVKVRLMHAEVRRMLLRSPRFDVSRWGVPINQHDMVSTTLLFSHAVIHGMRGLGFRVDADEARTSIQLWKYVGWLMGAREDLLPDDEADCWRITELVQATQGPPDADSIALTRALLDSPIDGAREAAPSEQRRARGVAAVARGFCRGLLGDDLADALEVPRTPIRHAPFVLRCLSPLFPRALEGTLARRVSIGMGRAYWNFVVGQAARRGVRYEFGVPPPIR